MGYATIKRVPRVDNHRHAKQLHDNNKPIRGRLPEVRPLGERRDADAYSIRKNGDAIELVLYKTPVITFTPDDEVELFVGSYSTVSTHQFIRRVLDIPAGGVRGKTLLTINGVKVVLDNDEKLRLKRDESGNWHSLSASTQYGWKLNRKATAEVRAKYAEFYKYLKAFVNLRTEPIKHRWLDVEKDYVTIQTSEYKNVFGKLMEVREYGYMDKRGQHMSYVSVKPEQYKESTEKFIRLIAPNQPEEDKHTNFYKAALLLVAKCDSERMDIRAEEVDSQAKHIVPKLDEILFQFYAHDVLVREAMPQGKVSSGKYDSWMAEWE
jgi:hypothetical protein